MIGCGAVEPKFESCWLCSAIHTLQCFRLDQCTSVLPLEKCKMSIWEFVCLHFLSSNLKLRQHSSGSCKELKITTRQSSNTNILNFLRRCNPAFSLPTKNTRRQHFCFALTKELRIGYPANKHFIRVCFHTFPTQTQTYTYRFKYTNTNTNLIQC